MSGQGRRARAAGFRWTAPRELAAVLVAQDARTNPQIAAAVGVGERTLMGWKRQPEFQQRVAEHVAAFRAAAAESGLAEVEQRVAELTEAWRGMKTVIAERGRLMAPLAEKVPGAATGLLVRETKVAGSGPNPQVIEEYVVDVPLLREMRETQKQAAQELGQWAERKEVSGPANGPIEVIYVNDWRSRPIDGE